MDVAEAVLNVLVPEVSGDPEGIKPLVCEMPSA